MYSIGQKVVCINDEFSDWIKSIYTALPVKNSTYTIRDVRPGINEDNKTYEVAVLLEELTNPLNSAKVPQERAFNVERFAPLNPFTEEEEEEDKAPIHHERELAGV